jgi:thymidylate kinase
VSAPAVVEPPGSSFPHSSSSDRLLLVLRLGRLLDEGGVGYCHWKSNTALDRSLSGDNDLDLLVRRSDARRFAEALSELGFTRARKRSVPDDAIESFYGYDADGDRIVHVHAHYRLVVGHDCTKNYGLPIEDAYIDSAAPADVLRVPSPAFEFAVFAIRMTLKYCTWDEIAWCALRGRRAGPKESERRELADLYARVDVQEVAALVETYLPSVGAALFHDCVEALVARVSVRRRTGTARRLERALQPHGRRSRGADRRRRITGRIALVLARRTKRMPKNRLATGGAIVGIAGGDGSGKTTALTTLRAWLGSEFKTTIVHLGKPRWSATTYAVRAVFKVVNTAVSGLNRLLPTGRTRRLAGSLDRTRRLFWLTCTARDRYRAYGRVRRLALGGSIVLCDRYPHPWLTSMEVPQIERLVDHPGRVVRALIRLERRYHAAIAPPDLLVVLRVDPETAVGRKTEERPDSVRARGAEIWNIDWRAAGVPVVDANQPADMVARELKSLVWAAIG